MKEDRVGGGRWFCGVILLLAGCASTPEVMIQSLPNAGEARPSGGSVVGGVSVREAGLSGRDDRIFLTYVSVKNRTGTPVAFGPQYVYLADAGGTLIPRISEQWLPRYYEASMRGIPVGGDREAIPAFPSAKVTLGGVAYTAPPLTNAQRDEMAKELAKLVEVAFVAPQKAVMGLSLDKGSDVALGVLLKEVALGPGDAASGYVYFYQPASARPTYPLRLVIEFQDEINAFQFRER
jgi:hypothetical protein